MAPGRTVLLGVAGLLVVVAAVAGLVVRAEHARYGDYATCMRARGHEVSDPEVGLTGDVSVDQAGPVGEAGGGADRPGDDVVAVWRQDGAACADEAGLAAMPGGGG